MSIRTTAALVAALLFASPARAQLGHNQSDSIPRQGDVFVGPVTNDSEAGYYNGHYGPMRFEIPAWPYPDGLPPIYMNDVEIVGIAVKRSTQYGLENGSQFPVTTAEVGRYTTGKILYPPEFPWPHSNEPIATYTTSFAVYGQTGPLTPFDGTFDGIPYMPKPDGSSGYWGGGNSDGQPDTLNLYVPWWGYDNGHAWWAGKLNDNGDRMVEFVWDNEASWWFYNDDDEPLPPGHWYVWEDRIGTWVESPPEGVRYFFQRPDGNGGLLPEESVFVPYPVPGLPMTYVPEPLGVVRSKQRLEPDPIGAGVVELDSEADRLPSDVQALALPFRGPVLARKLAGSAPR